MAAKSSKGNSMARWTEKDKETLFAMRAEGKTWLAIAEALHRDYDSVISFNRDEKRRRSNKRIKAECKHVVFGPPPPSPDYLYTGAVSRLMSRLISDTGKDMVQVRAMLLGPEPARKSPGSEVIHKTQSVNRLVYFSQRAA